MRDQLRKAFRNSSPEEYDETRIRNTVGFLTQASHATGIEHKILKNIVHVRYYEQEQLCVSPLNYDIAKDKTDHILVERLLVTDDGFNRRARRIPLHGHRKSEEMDIERLRMLCDC